MSTEVANGSFDNVDVDLKVKDENKSEISCDSGIETLDSNSLLCSLSSESNLTPTKCIRETAQSQKFHVPETLISNETRSNNSISESKIINNEDSINKPSIDTFESSDENIPKLKHDIQNNVDCERTNNLLNGVNLATSTVSLNEQTPDTIADIKHSKSVDNLSVFEIDSKTSSLADLDKEKIISQFSNQKCKVSARQKIPDPNTDYKYGRIPKEILSQDLGSIVKNVHGIFSSVSGSLKNAYNSSHLSVQKQPLKYVKSVTNGKMMNDIFEDTDTNAIMEIQKTENPICINNCEINPDSLTSSVANETTDVDTKNDMLKLQVESLERVLAEQRKENVSLREKVKQQVDELQAKDQIFKEFEVKVDLMCKRAEQAQKEKDAAVMRYASTECAAIEAKKAAEAAAKSEKAAIVEKDLLIAKLKTAREEKQRICQLYDDKCHELQNSEREVGKVREELKELEGRLKWTQSKLRMEMDAYKEYVERAERLSQQVTELEAAKEAAIINAPDSVRARQLESDLKENHAALILCRHEKEDLERRLTATLQQLDSCRKERDDAKDALASAKTQVEKLEQSNLRLEEEAAELAALRAKAALADTLSSQLKREVERANQAEEALREERARAETCGRREAEALQHAATLTAHHVAERARAADAHAKAQALTADNQSLRERLSVLESENTRLQTALENETERRNKENRVLARKVAEMTEELEEANKKLEWEKGENNILKKKHSSAIKELNRELQRALKRIEQLEAKLPPPNDADSTGTGSVSSLSSSDSPEERTQTDTMPSVQAREPDRQALIERIVSLQRAAARRAERCEFLEEHAKTLTAELRAKSRLLRKLLPALPTAELAPAAADGAKAAVVRAGGAMAAVWGGDPAGLPPALALEMNTRLQALLEDTLLKNITLKENIDTLGEEIARLKAQKNDTK